VLAEGALTHRRRGLWPARRGEYGADVRARLERATGITLEDYGRAVAARERIRDAVAETFRSADMLIGLGSAAGPARIDVDPADPGFRRAVMSCTAPQSLCGLPSCTVRSGFDGRGLPVSVQITGRPGDDLGVLGVATDIFGATPDVQRVTPAVSNGHAGDRHAADSI
jgi:aspartyl-tRNA(Asn)/glutamyl-tRNA(Gln) amidotransferase subunit A